MSERKAKVRFFYTVEAEITESSYPPGSDLQDIRKIERDNAEIVMLMELDAGNGALAVDAQWGEEDET